MKNLKHYQQQVKRSRAEHRFQQWANDQIERTLRPILAASQERMQGIQDDLKLQRCKLETTIKKHPMAEQFDDFFGLLRAAEFFEQEAAYPFL